MGAASLAVDPTNVVQSLVYTLLDVLDATRDLFITLRHKEERDRERELISNGYSVYADNERLNDEGIVLDKAAVMRQYDIGVSEIGPQFAIGDVVSQTALQSQIIVLQSVIITTFLYGPTSPEPISHQLSNILDASRVAGTTSVDVLAAQQQRHRSFRPVDVRSSVVQPLSPYAATNVPPSSTVSATQTKSRGGSSVAYPAKTTIVSLADRPKTHRTDTETTAYTDESSAKSTPQPLYCLYALDLQRDPSQHLSPCLQDSSSPYCPYCKRVLNLQPGKSWEVFKDDGRVEHRFRIQNRFVAKCHRNSVDGGYLCVLCSKNDDTAVCGDVKALVRHVWMDHEFRELKAEEDIVEVIEYTGRRRDSLMSFTESKRGSDRRSASVGPSRGGSQRRAAGTERDWSPRRDA